MANEMMDLQELATYLQRDLREVSKLASRGHLPGQKICGEWRFARAEINHWLETQMPVFTEQQLTAMEARHAPGNDREPLIAALLSQACMAVPLAASTRPSVLRELVRLAEQSWQVYDPEGLLDNLRQREELGSTALDNGIALPHPKRPLPTLLGESLIAFGRTSTGIPFGGARGALTDIFFLLCCRDERTHLQVLARLSRLILRPGFLDELRAADTTTATWQVIEAAEKDLLSKE